MPIAVHQYAYCCALLCLFVLIILCLSVPIVMLIIVQYYHYYYCPFLIFMPVVMHDTAHIVLFRDH